MISTSPKKEKEARNTLGADHFVVSKDEAQMSVRSPPQLCTSNTMPLISAQGLLQVLLSLKLLDWHCSCPAPNVQTCLASRFWQFLHTTGVAVLLGACWVCAQVS